MSLALKRHVSAWIVAGLLVLALVLWPGGARSAAEVNAPILFPGLCHMRNPGPDAFSFEAGDVQSEKGQQEIVADTNMLA